MNTIHYFMRPAISIGMLLAVIVLTACSLRKEEAAQQMLQEARIALKHHQYSEAKDSILSLRKKHPHALQARRQGILLLDSIEMMAAADSLTKAEGEEWERLNMKKKFFERKLQEDLKRATQEEQSEKK
ncbi:MAG: hypothetical protein ACI4B5_04635 [Bacteroidaceae bacterium]